MSETKEYIHVAETAKLLRASLKRTFPGVKFGVRSKSYSGGASIRVSWVNGPKIADVDRVCCRFSGADFDGMQDLKTYHNSILVDDTGNPRRVHFGADFIFCDRDESPTLRDAVIAKLGETWEPLQWAKMPSYEKERMARQGIIGLDIPTDEPETTTVERAVAAFFAR